MDRLARLIDQPGEDARGVARTQVIENVVTWFGRRESFEEYFEGSLAQNCAS